jgi:hypothetical protein
MYFPCRLSEFIRLDLHPQVRTLSITVKASFSTIILSSVVIITLSLRTRTIIVLLRAKLASSLQMSGLGEARGITAPYTFHRYCARFLTPAH